MVQGVEVDDHFLLEVAVVMQGVEIDDHFFLEDAVVGQGVEPDDHFLLEEVVVGQGRGIHLLLEVVGSIVMVVQSIQQEVITIGLSGCSGM